MLLLCLPVSVRFTADRAFRLCLRVWFLPLYRYPKPEKPVRLRDYTRRALARREKTRRRKEERKARKEARRAERKARKLARKKGAAPAKTAPRKKKPGGEITRWLRLSQKLAALLISQFHRHLRLKVCRLRIKVATGDAASTAILYGAVCSGVTCLLEVLSHALRVKKSPADDVRVDIDYLADRTEAEADIRFSMPLGWALLLALRLFFGYITAI